MSLMGFGLRENKRKKTRKETELEET